MDYASNRGARHQLESNTNRLESQLESGILQRISNLEQNGILENQFKLQILLHTPHIEAIKLTIFYTGIYLNKSNLTQDFVGVDPRF